jgi:hypothetical protein
MTTSHPFCIELWLHLCDVVRTLLLGVRYGILSDHTVEALANQPRLSPLQCKGLRNIVQSNCHGEASECTTSA